MAQTGYTPIQLYYSTTASSVPLAGDLANGELAINITDGKLYYKDNGGTVQLLASNSATTNVASISFGSTGLTPSTATTGAVTVAGTLAVANGGTGQTTYTNGQLLIGNTTGNTLTKATLTAGSGISITNGNGSITIASTVSVTEATPTTLGTVYGLAGTAFGSATGLGYAALSALTSGIYNTGIGVNALDAVTSGYQNTAVGGGALTTITTEGDCTAVGYNALANNTGFRNTAVGSAAFSQNTSGTNNVAIGYQVLNVATAISDSVVVGSRAGLVTTGSENILIGYGAGSANQVTGQGTSLTSGTNNILIGRTVQPSSATVSNEITIGNSSNNVFRIPGLSLTWTTSGLPIANGGTGATTAPAANANLTGFTTTATAAGTTTLTNTSSSYQIFTGTSTQTVVLPVTSTLTQGWSFHIVNNSTGNLTVNSSGSNLVITVLPGTTAMVTCILTSGTTAASWEAGYTDFSTATGTGAVVLGTSPSLTTPTLSGPTINDGYTEEVFAVTDAAGVALSPTNGSIQTWTLGASRTPTSGTWNAGQSMTLMIDDGTAYTVTWTTLNVVWETDNGSAPTLATSGFTVIVLWKVGTQIYGARVGNA